MKKRRKRQGGKKWRADGLNMRMYREQEGRCFYCDKHMKIPPSGVQRVQPDDIATREHLQPRCEGGSNARSNLALACKGCNGRRDRRPWQEFKAMMGELA